MNGRGVLGVVLLGCEQKRPFAVQKQPAVGHAGAAHQLHNRKRSPTVVRLASLKREPGERLGLGWLLGPQCGDLSTLRARCRGERPRCSGETCPVARLEVPQSDDHRAAWPELLRSIDLVLGIPLPAAVERDLAAAVYDGDLHTGLGIGRFGGEDA